MAKKLNYDPKSLLNIKFSPSNAGYNSDEVDAVFDKMIEDYESLIAECDKAAKQKDLEVEKYNKVKEELERTNFELAQVKEKLSNLKKMSGITDDNYSLMLKVSNYERVLHRKGIDLKKALSDPDNC